MAVDVALTVEVNFDFNYEWSLFPIYSWMRDRNEHRQTLNEAGGTRGPGAASR